MRSWDDLGKRRRAWVIAPRGHSARFPENTLAAFEGAVAAGADAIELDVRLTADDAAVVIHDATLDRTTSGQGRVRAHHAARITALDAGSWFARAFASEHVPTLDQVVDRFAGRVALDLELKVDEGGADAARLAAVVAARIGRGGPATGTLLSSFCPAVLEAARMRLPDTPRVLLVEGTLEPAAIFSTARQLDAVGVGLDAEMLEASLLDAFHDAGFPVLLFTVDRKTEMQAWIRAGVDGIFSNRPARLRRVVEGAT